MLYDGYGVICFTLEVRSDSEPAQGAPEMTGAPTNLQSRNFTTGCCSVQPFHKQAVFAWKKRKEGAHLPTVYYTYEQWAVTQLSWLPRQTNPPTTSSISGHRIMVPDRLEGQPEDPADERSCLGNHRLTMYDFSPYNVKEAMHITGAKLEDSAEHPRSGPSNMWTLRPLRSTNDANSGTQFPEGEEGVLQRCLMLTSGPGLIGPEHMSTEYITNAPYILATRSIQLYAPGVECIPHQSHSQLLLVLVWIVSFTSFSRMLTTCTMSCNIPLTFLLKPAEGEPNQASLVK
ncbi:hypothetical protein QFC24_003449 [Naganishia onofrii]|uniref:Uncharacterized protein n=1 Tax=Naganishia onofrii TaxID=1851511 RepID=A0ACC2XJ56_9TREE|nr:hypothetical protein QFC24_003449 [Naganishia onofrii]